MERGGLSVDEVLGRARDEFSDAESFDDVDGLKMIYADSWVHMRPSGTEPILRIFVEALDTETADAFMLRAKSVIAG